MGESLDTLVVRFPSLKSCAVFISINCAWIQQILFGLTGIALFSPKDMPAQCFIPSLHTAVTFPWMS
jgi:hypothetical protein